jgi:hypothetical protein
MGGMACQRRSLKQMEAAAQEGLTVLLFERMDESIVLLLDMLDMPLSAGLADSGKVVVTKSNPHPKPSDWPPEVVMGFKNMATRVGCAAHAHTLSNRDNFIRSQALQLSSSR